MFKLNKSHKGFTLIELLIVMAVLAVLAAVVVPNVTGFLGRGKERAWTADRDILQAAVDAWRTDIRSRAGNPWPILAAGGAGDLPAALQPGPNPNATTRGYIDIGALASAGYLKTSDAVRSANKGSNTTAANTPNGSYHWFIDSTGVINSWADANNVDPAASGITSTNYTAGELGFQTNIYP